MANSMNVSPIKNNNTMMLSNNSNNFTGQVLGPQGQKVKQVGSSSGSQGTSKHPILANKQVKMQQQMQFK